MIKEPTLHIWSLTETTDNTIGHRGRYPARSVKLSEIHPGMNLAELFASDTIRRQHKIIVEEVKEDSVRITTMGSTVTLIAGQRYKTPAVRTDNIYIVEFVSLELELE